MSGHERRNGPDEQPREADRVQRKREDGTAAGAEHGLMRLQRSAGNAAVASAMSVQRTPVPGQISGAVMIDLQGAPGAPAPAASGYAPAGGAAPETPENALQDEHGF